MDSERWQRVAVLYDSAVEREPSERARFLAVQAAWDEDLRREVESLLAHDCVPVLIDRPMLESAAAVFEEVDLTAGTRLGPYRIETLLGAGGMGQVYRAIDTRLDRTVAIKVLPSTLATNPQFRARFDREAHAIASLSHPHICTLHDIGQHEDVSFLVMEYLEGETLAGRLDRGRLSVDQALSLAVQIAGALAAAHRQGIVHGDLKPGNIILTSSGPKLLDFGLARPVVSVPPEEGPSTPTTHANLTADATILGTLQYMAPEQLEGKVADARTDIFAFGAVVYEMLTGKKAFDGGSGPDLIDAILHAEPPAISAPQPRTPPALDRIVSTCLAKDPDNRWQSARDLSRELQWVAHGPTAPAAIPKRSMVWNALRIAAAGIVVAALGGYAAWTLKPAPSRSVAVTRFSVTLPEDMRLTGGTARNIAMSPDGSRIALVANDQLYVRNLAADEEFHPITGTDQNLRLRFPFFSPDGQWLAFWSTSGGGTLKKVPVTGGAAIAICEVRSTFGTPYGASWSPDNLIFIGGGPNGILRVSAEGGRPETIIGVNSGQFASNPQLLPDGEHVLFTLREPDSEGDLTRQRNWDQAKLVVESLKSRERTVLIDGGYDGRYSSTGHIVYVLASTLWARRFDLATRQVFGEPLPVAEGVATEGLGRFSTGSADFSFSHDGAMAYVPAARRNARPLRSLALIDLSGRITPVDLPAGPYHSPRFSLPDGEQIALYTTDGVIWIYQLSGTKPIRKLTHEGGYLFPMWTRDGRVVFNSIVEGRRGLFWQPADGSAPVERLTSSSAFPYSVSPDGRTIFAGGERSNIGQAIVTLSLNGDAISKTVFQGAKGDVVFSPSLSPDGRWLAYELRHQNTSNVYVDPFPPTGAHHPVTIDGGSNPLWSPDGTQLFYVRETALETGRERATFHSVEVLRTSASFEHGKPNALFSVDGLFIRGSLAGNVVDLSPDGKQFVTLLLPPGSDGEPEQPQVNVVLNWFAELKQHVAVK